MNKRTCKCYVVFCTVILLSCIFSGGCQVFCRSDQEMGEGHLLIQVDIPEIFSSPDLTTSSILQDIEITHIIYTIRQGRHIYAKEVEVDGGDHVVILFDSVPGGTYEVEILALDSLGHRIAEGRSEVTVRPAITSEVEVQLNLTPGHLLLHINTPDTEGIASGQVTLLGLMEELEDRSETFTAQPGTSMTLDMGTLMARIWMLEAHLYNGHGDILLSGEAQIPILPGYLQTAHVSFSQEGPGDLEVSIQWNMPPERPENVTTTYCQKAVIIRWDEVTEAEGYMVIRSSESEEEGSMLATSLIRANSIEDTHVFTEGKTYDYRVVAYNEEGLSSDFSQPASITIPLPPAQSIYEMLGFSFAMRLAPEATFPAGEHCEERNTVENAFWIAETPVTYEVWYRVREWAEGNGYTFRYPGQEGGQTEEGDPGALPSERRREPVTNISWYDTLVWCNAVSALAGYAPVYHYNGAVLMDATLEVADHELEIEETGGFRLPVSKEWELAARYQGKDSGYGALEYPENSNRFWTLGKYASGATGPYSDEEATARAAWYLDNSDGATQEVGQKPEGGNGLLLYDMSGNISEWCTGWVGTLEITRGGSWEEERSDMQLWIRKNQSRGAGNSNTGFRLARNEE